MKEKGRTKREWRWCDTSSVMGRGRMTVQPDGPRVLADRFEGSFRTWEILQPGGNKIIYMEMKKLIDEQGPTFLHASPGFNICVDFRSSSRRLLFAVCSN